MNLGGGATGMLYNIPVGTHKEGNDMKIKVNINLYTDGDYGFTYNEETGGFYYLDYELADDNCFEFIDNSYYYQMYTLSAVFNNKSDAERFLKKVFCNIRVGYTHYYIAKYLFDMFDNAIKGLYSDNENYCYAVSGNYEGTYIKVDFEED